MCFQSLCCCVWGSLAGLDLRTTTKFRDMLQMVSGPCKDENAEPADGPITPTVFLLAIDQVPNQGRNRVIMFVVDLNIVSVHRKFVI